MSSLVGKAAASTMITDIEKNIGSLFGGVTNGRKICNCLTQTFESLSDLIHNPTPQEKQKREFQRKYVKRLRQGECFMLVHYEKEENAVAKFSKSVMGTLGFGSPNDEGPNSSDVDKAVLLRLSNDNLSFEWSTLALVQNKPQLSGKVKLGDIKRINDAHTESTKIEIFGERERSLLVLSGSDVELVSDWVVMMKQSINAFADLIEESNSQEKGLLYRQERLLELERRKREREKQKLKLNQKLGAKGYVKT
mmetsp:Transcript_9319/g.11167  ORF Transcript_9319/g.11167 Transcript_9319/m.11167 type:complete len:251 (-) Transcript_9319:1072-1824(-)